MTSVLGKAIEIAQSSIVAFSKFITPNDTGATGAHQSGFHIHKNAWSLFFTEPGKKGANKDAIVRIKWQDDFETTSRCIYYGVGSRNEYRLTRFGRGFPFLNEENVGDLLVLCKIGEEYYSAFVLSSDEEIEEFFVAMNISSENTNSIIPKQFEVSANDSLVNCFRKYIATLRVEFPKTIDIANSARTCYNRSFSLTNEVIRKNPDGSILNWLDAEFQLFKMLENNRYNERIQRPFVSVEELIEVANTILNRRKSRAGKSLEHHLSEIFRIFGISFETQSVTESNKKPDFIFPNIEAYQNPNFNSDKLVMLACKTTCKDRWRQILNEADRIKTKHLFTLQQGISKNQLEEMYRANVCLVVPEPYLKSFPKEYRPKILTLENFSMRLPIF